MNIRYIGYFERKIAQGAGIYIETTQETMVGFVLETIIYNRVIYEKLTDLIKAKTNIQSDRKIAIVAAVIASIIKVFATFGPLIITILSETAYKDMPMCSTVDVAESGSTEGNQSSNNKAWTAIKYALNAAHIMVISAIDRLTATEFAEFMKEQRQVNDQQRQVNAHVEVRFDQQQQVNAQQQQVNAQQQKINARIPAPEFDPWEYDQELERLGTVYRSMSSDRDYIDAHTM